MWKEYWVWESQLLWQFLHPKPIHAITGRKSESMTGAFIPTLEKLSIMRCDLPRFIVVNLVIAVILKEFLGNRFTEPVDAPDLPQFRLINMYHSCTDSVVKETM